MKRVPIPGRRPWWRRLTAATGMLTLVVTALVGSATTPAQAAPWTPKPAPMTTPWTGQVPVDNPLPEYPRPSSPAPTGPISTASGTSR